MLSLLMAYTLGSTASHYRIC